MRSTFLSKDELTTPFDCMRKPLSFVLVGVFDCTRELQQSDWEIIASRETNRTTPPRKDVILTLYSASNKPFNFIESGARIARSGFCKRNILVFGPILLRLWRRWTIEATKTRAMRRTGNSRSRGCIGGGDGTTNGSLVFPLTTSEESFISTHNNS